MELAQAEALGTLDHHDGCIRHVHPHFYDGGGNQDLGPSGGKCGHVEILHLRGLLPVHYRHLVIRIRETL